MISDDDLRELIEELNYESNRTNSHLIKYIGRIHVDDTLSALHELLTLHKNTRIALDLAIDYDGFDTVDGLKSLVDDIVSALKGETKWEKL